MTMTKEEFENFEAEASVFWAAQTKWSDQANRLLVVAVVALFGELVTLVLFPEGRLVCLFIILAACIASSWCARRSLKYATKIVNLGADCTRMSLERMSRDTKDLLLTDTEIMNTVVQTTDTYDSSMAMAKYRAVCLAQVIKVLSGGNTEGGTGGNSVA